MAMFTMCYTGYPHVWNSEPDSFCLACGKTRQDALVPLPGILASIDAEEIRASEFLEMLERLECEEKAKYLC